MTLDAIKFGRRPRSVAKVTTYAQIFPSDYILCVYKTRTTLSGLFYSAWKPEMVLSSD
jgi:hypothetical protein